MCIRDRREGVLRNIYATYLRNVLQVERRFLEVDNLLMQLCREVETRLEKLPPPDPDMKFYDHRAWKDPETVPPGLAFAPSQGVNASFEVPLYKLSGTSVPEWKSFLTALIPMTDSCRNIVLWNALDPEENNGPADLAKVRHPVIAVYIGLQNGLFLTYPYTADFPADYDHRTRPWYRRSLKNGNNKVVWTDPYFDRSVGKTVISASFPVRDHRSGITGVLGIDLEPDTMIKAFIQHDRFASEYVIGQYLINENGMIIASDGALKPDGRDVRMQMFPYMQSFPEIKRLKTGRLFADRTENHVIIFHFIKSLNCYFVEIIDFGSMMKNRTAAAD